jgi:hypothetical protein
MAKKRCKFGRVKTGSRKGLCRKRKLTGAAARKSKSGGSKRRRKGAAFKRGRKKNIVGKKASGSGRFCLMKRTDKGRSSTRCYSSESGALNAMSRMIQRGGGKTRYRSIMLYSKKRA